MFAYSVKDMRDAGLSEEQIAAIMKAVGSEDGNCKTQDHLVDIVEETPASIDVAPAAREIREPGITSFDDLVRYSAGSVVKLPDFANGQPFIARLKRPSMLALAKSGRIPNALLKSAMSLFAEGGNVLRKDDNGMLGELYDICRIMCDAALVEPKLSDIEKAGLELSDDQLMAIFNYTQSGVNALSSFR